MAFLIQLNKLLLLQPFESDTCYTPEVVISKCPITTKSFIIWFASSVSIVTATDAARLFDAPLFNNIYNIVVII